MDFVLTLHGHLPYVLHHGRWPHGSVWLCEGALDSYLPLIEALQALEKERIPAPITLGITPVLANQLAHPSFVSEFEAYMERRLESAAQAPASLAPSGDMALQTLPDAATRTPYTAYRVASADGKARDLFALVRDPKSSAQVWSRAQGYPGDEWY